MTDAPKLSEHAFDQQMQQTGWVLFERVLPPDSLAAIRTAILDSVEACGRMQVSSGARPVPDGTAHHAVGRYPALDDFLARADLASFISRHFGGAPYILHAFNPASIPPGHRSYLHGIHRDVRTHAGGFAYMLNMLVMVDEFTTENGATHVLSGSHTDPEPPCAARFAAQSKRLVGPAGSIVLFNSNLWHAAGHNTSARTRTALTLSFSRSFVKQQMDYPRFVDPSYAASLPPYMRQILGFNAMVPLSYEEFYRPAHSRLYQADQG